MLCYGARCPDVLLGTLINTIQLHGWYNYYVTVVYMRVCVCVCSLVRCRIGVRWAQEPTHIHSIASVMINYVMNAATRNCDWSCYTCIYIESHIGLQPWNQLCQLPVSEASPSILCVDTCCVQVYRYLFEIYIYIYIYIILWREDFLGI